MDYALMDASLLTRGRVKSVFLLSTLTTINYLTRSSKEVFFFLNGCTQKYTMRLTKQLWIVNFLSNDSISIHRSNDRADRGLNSFDFDRESLFEAPIKPLDSLQVNGPFIAWNEQSTIDEREDDRNRVKAYDNLASRTSITLGSRFTPTDRSRSMG